MYVCMYVCMHVCMCVYVCMYVCMSPLNTQTWRAKWHEMGDLGKDARDVPRCIQGQHGRDAQDIPVASTASMAVEWVAAAAPRSRRRADTTTPLMHAETSRCNARCCQSVSVQRPMLPDGEMHGEAHMCKHESSVGWARYAQAWVDHFLLWSSVRCLVFV